MSCKELCKECGLLLSEAYQQMQSRVAKRLELEDGSQPVQITEEVLREEFCQAFGELQKKENFPKGRLAGCRAMHLVDLFWARSACLYDPNSVDSMFKWVNEKLVPRMLNKYRSHIARDAGDELPIHLLGPRKSSSANPKNPKPVRLRKYLGESSLEVWLAIVFRNLMRDMWRKWKRRKDAEQLLLDGEKNGKGFENVTWKSPSIREQLRLSVIQFLSGRTVQQQKVFKLRVVEGRTNEDCAAELDCEPGNVSDRLKNFLENLCKDKSFRNSLVAVEKDFGLQPNSITQILQPVSGIGETDEKQEKAHRKRLEDDLGKLFNWSTDEDTRDDRLRQDVFLAFVRAICRLPAEQKMVLKLRVLDGLSAVIAASHMFCKTERVVRQFDQAVLKVCRDRQLAGELQWLEMEFDRPEHELRAAGSTTAGE
jgi:RNA polymerase sigma factor (sigma-70 family)